MTQTAQKNLNGNVDKMTNYDPLISGKNPLERVATVEIEEDKAILFIETLDNGIQQEVVRNKFWVLTPYKERSSVKLEGNLHYSWGNQFSSKSDWYKFLQNARKKNKDFYTVYDPKESFLIKYGYTLYKGMKHTEPSILSFDIESTGLYHDENSKVLLISNTFRKNGVITRKLFAYDEYSSQGEMITHWCNWIREIDPSIIAGHNIYTYDFRYLDYVASREGIELNLGRDGSALTIADRPSKFRIDGSRDQEYHKVRVYGREVIDTMFLAIRHDVATKKYESYGLKSIIKAEGLEKKDRQHYDSSQIRFKYTDPNEWEKIKAYCEHDADDALALYDLCAPATFYLTQSVPKTFQQMVESATGSQINAMMVRSYLQEGHSIPKATQTHQFEGAISFGNPGIYRNVHKIDVASLYPSIILACQVYDEDKDPKGNFLKIIEKFTAERLKNKKLAKDTGDAYYDGLQNAQKIVINSGYGFMGAPGLQFNSPSAAEFITRTGREVLGLAIRWAEAKGFTIPNADTDSISYCKHDQSIISPADQLHHLEEVNSLCPDRIRYEDDGFYPTVAILKAKNYVLYDGKKVKIKGSALKATTKAPAMKEMINRFIQCILDGKQDFQDIYHEYIKEACNVKDIKRWAVRKTISEKVLAGERTNETKILKAIEGTEIVEGDRCYMFTTPDNQLKLVEQFDGQYNVDKLLQNCYDTAWTFDSVLDCELLFPNYKLKKNKPKLQELLNGK